MALFHVSEDPSIRTFRPRPAPSWLGRSDDLVWAIDEIHLPNYLLPRDCPRVTYRLLPTTSTEDRTKFFTGDATHVVTIDADWLDAAIDSPVTIYELPSEQFQLLDVSAGYWVSRVEVKPLNMLEVRRPLSEIVKRGVEVRVVPKLWDLREPVVRSTVDYSIIRMKDPPSG